jgi:SRSO17 transposase
VDAAEPDRSYRQPFVCEPRRLVASSRWDVNGVRDDVRDWLLEQFDGQAPDGEPRVLIPAKVEFRKTGTRLVGVHREYSETARRIENVQVGLFLVYATADRWALVDRELYLPPSWTADPERCRLSGVPERVGFVARSHLAHRMIERALGSAAPAAWVAAGEVFGDDPSFRSSLDRTDRPYVLATRAQDRVAAGAAGAGTVDEVVRGLPDTAWRRGDAGAGGEWVRVPLPQPAGFETAWERLILARRAPGEPDRIACYRCRVHAGTPDRDLVRVARALAGVEQRIVQAMRDLGVDGYRARRYDTWYRHVTLCMLAAACRGVGGEPA